MKKRLMIVLCCLILLVQLLPIVPMAETQENSWEKVWGSIPDELYYCREQLKTLENSEALLWAYDNIVAGIDACAEEIAISNYQYELTLEEFEMVLEATRRDHTEQFWMGTTYTPYVDTITNVVKKIVPTYSMSGDELQDAKTEFNQAINLLIGRLDPNMSEYEKEKALHDMLAVQVSYVSTNNSHNAYGALVEGKAVCEGYAEALQCALQLVGIQSVEIFGYGINPATGRGEAHAWNTVRIDGEYYHVDLTWNDQDTILLHAYFNQTSAILDEDHEQWRVGRKANGEELNCEVFELPVCTATEANYFTKENMRIKTYTVASIGKLLKDNNLSVHLFIDSDVKKFTQWYDENIVALAGAAGVSGDFFYGSTQIGREILIYIETCQHENMTLVKAKPATCDADGNTAYYICQNKDCGKWFADADAQSEIFNRDSVKVFSIGHTWTRKIDETTLKEGNTYWYTCSACNQISTTDHFTLEVEHTCEKVNIFLEIWNAILNFFRGLFGLPELCTCGEILDNAQQRQGLLALSFFFYNGAFAPQG